MKYLLTALVPVLLIASCSPVSTSRLNQVFHDTESEFQDHTGFMLYDLKEKKQLYAYNADKYFTPASNTKIFTLYTGLSILGDSVPALKYEYRGDSLLIWGTGDPSLFYENVSGTGKVFNFLKATDKQIYFSADNFYEEHFGPGWAWSDYRYTYSVERSPLPIYGNAVKVAQTSTGYLRLTPPVFTKYVWLVDTVGSRTAFVREVGSNHVDFYPGKSITDRVTEFPFRCEPILIAEMLSDTLRKPVHLAKGLPSSSSKTLHSLPSDSLYRVMMQASDNFIAEQVLLMCAGVLSDSLSTRIAIREMKQKYLNDLPDDIRWVDGSGLSRYNLFTPRAVVRLWEKIYQAVPQERLFTLLAIGGRKGTIRNYFRADVPYIYAKTGTLSNNHVLSGFIIARSGRLMIFSFMNNNYTVPTGRIRTRMEEVLKRIYENY